MANLTRRRFVTRATGAISGLIGYAAIPPGIALAASNCKQQGFTVCPNGSSSTCNVAYGAPSCTQSGPITVYSPNNKWVLYNCKVYCSQGCMRCQGGYFQARGAVANGGNCSCTEVI